MVLSNPLRVVNYCDDEEIHNPSDIKFSEREKLLHKEYTKGCQNFKKEYKFSLAVLRGVQKLVPKYPKLRLRGDWFLFFEDEHLPRIDGVDLVTGPYRNYKHANPYMIEDHIKIHQYEYGVIICSTRMEDHGYKIDNEFDEYTEDWKPSTIKMAIREYKLYCKKCKKEEKEEKEYNEDEDDDEDYDYYSNSQIWSNAKLDTKLDAKLPVLPINQK